MTDTEIRRAWNLLEIHDMSYQQFRREMRIVTDETLAAKDLKRMSDTIQRGRSNKQRFDQILRK